MYRGFNIENISFTAKNDLVQQYERSILDIDINENLIDFLDDDYVFDASAIQKDWFPQINADIFISHSHRDEKTAKALAMWLKNEFNLTAFIDSAVWGYFEDLLLTIQQTTDLASATSHVHMMLNMALMQMIDKTECLFFLNTPNSITLSNEIDAGTYSPWIYSELGISQMIDKKLPERYTRQAFSSRGSESLLLIEDAKFRYDLDISHLITLGNSELNAWHQKVNPTEFRANALRYAGQATYKKHPLDVLYMLYPLNQHIRG